MAPDMPIAQWPQAVKASRTANNSLVSQSPHSRLNLNTVDKVERYPGGWYAALPNRERIVYMDARRSIRDAARIWTHHRNLVPSQEDKIAQASFDGRVVLVPLDLEDGGPVAKSFPLSQM